MEKIREKCIYARVGVSLAYANRFHDYVMANTFEVYAFNYVLINLERLALFSPKRPQKVGWKKLKFNCGASNIFHWNRFSERKINIDEWLRSPLLLPASNTKKFRYRSLKIVRASHLIFIFPPRAQFYIFSFIRINSIVLFTIRRAWLSSLPKQHQPDREEKKTPNNNNQLKITRKKQSNYVNLN